MNTTNTQQAQVGDVSVGAEMLRRLATLTEAIGHTVHYRCPKGFGPRDMPLVSVELPDGHTTPLLRFRNEYDSTVVVSLCSKCEVSVVMDLGTVEL